MQKNAMFIKEAFGDTSSTGQLTGIPVYVRPAHAGTPVNGCLEADLSDLRTLNDLHEVENFMDEVPAKVISAIYGLDFPLGSHGSDVGLALANFGFEGEKINVAKADADTCWTIAVVAKEPHVKSYATRKGHTMLTVPATGYNIIFVPVAYLGEHNQPCNGWSADQVRRSLKKCFAT